MEVHVQRIAHQMDVLYIAVVEHKVYCSFSLWVCGCGCVGGIVLISLLYVHWPFLSFKETGEQHIRYLETGRFTGSFESLDLSPSSADEVNVTTTLDATEAAVAITATCAAADFAHQYITRTSSAAEVHDVRDVTQSTISLAAPMDVDVPAEAPLSTSISIMSPADVYELMQQREKDARIISRVFKRLATKNDNEVMKTLEYLFASKMTDQWNLKLCLLAVQHPNGKIATIIRSVTTDPDVLQQRVRRLDFPNNKVAPPPSYAVLALRDYPAVETIVLQQSMDYAALFSNVSDTTTKAAKKLTPKHIDADLTTRSDRVVLQFCAMKNCDPETALVSMFTRQWQAGHIPRQPTQTPPECDGFRDGDGYGEGAPTDVPIPTLSRSLHMEEHMEVEDGAGNSSDFFTLSPPPSAPASLLTVHSSVAHADPYIQFDRMLKLHQAVTPLLWGDMKLMCMPVASIVAHNSNLRFQPEHAFQYLDPDFGSLVCTCTHPGPFPVGQETCVHLVVFQRFMDQTATDSFPFTGYTTLSKPPCPDIVGNIVVDLSSAGVGQKLFAIVPLGVILDAAFVKVMKTAGTVTCSSSSCGVGGKSTIDSMDHLRLCVHIGKLAIFQQRETPAAQPSGVEDGVEEEDGEEGVDDQGVTGVVAEEAYDVGAASYVFPAHSSYRPEDLLGTFLSDGAFPEPYNASVLRMEATTGSVTKFRVGNRDVFAFEGSDLVPNGEVCCPCGSPRSKDQSSECVVYTFAGPVKRSVFRMVCQAGVCADLVYDERKDHLWFLTKTLAFHASLFVTFLHKPLTTTDADTFTSYAGFWQAVYAQKDARFTFPCPGTFSKAWFSYFSAHLFDFLEPCLDCQKTHDGVGFGVNSIGFDGISLGPRTRYKFDDISAPSPEAVVVPRASLRDERSALPLIVDTEGRGPRMLSDARAFMTTLATALKSSKDISVAFKDTRDAWAKVEPYFKLLANTARGINEFIEQVQAIVPGSPEGILFATLCSMLSQPTAVDGLFPPKRLDAVESWLLNDFPRMQHEHMFRSAQSAFGGSSREVLQVVREFGTSPTTRRPLLSYLSFVCNRMRTVKALLDEVAPLPQLAFIPGSRNPVVRVRVSVCVWLSLLLMYLEQAGSFYALNETGERRPMPRFELDDEKDHTCKKPSFTRMSGQHALMVACCVDHGHILG